MKKIVAIFMLFLVLGTSSHLKASMHFCGDVLTQFGWGDHETEPCECADMSSMDCCEDVVIKTQNPEPAVLSSVVFKHFVKELMLIAVQAKFELYTAFEPSNKQLFQHQFFRQKPENSLSFLSVFRI